MSDLYRVIYSATGADHQKSVSVSATSAANAIAAAKTNDRFFKDVVSAGVVAHNVVSGS